MDARQSLESLLESLGESSQFVTSGSSTPVLPGLEVKGVGSIGCPVAPADAKRLIAKAEQAPYGRGEKTLVDTSVRRVWQLDPSQFSLRNKEWNAHISAIVDAVGKEFGIRQKVTPTLYKLLIYEKGSFFVPHRDTEKLPGMFATLVVGLPSRHQGGTLIVRHDGQERKIDFGGKDSEFKTQYAAFYADCSHEIKPVTSGYRICLVYNLALAGNKRQPSAPQSSAIVEKAARLLEQIFANRALSKIAVPFVHQYTEAGLDPRQLKGADRACADVLARAAQSLDYQCYLALLTHWQSGQPDYSTMDHDPYRSHDSYGWYDDEDDDEEDAEDDLDDGDARVEMEEVFDESLTLDHWLNLDGHKQPFGEIHLEENEVLSGDDREGWACRQEIEEATGNAGISMERWYRQGVVVIWPRDRYFAILAGEGQASAIPALEQMAGRAKKPDAQEQCRVFAEQIIDRWQPGQTVGNRDSSWSARMLKLLERIGDADLAQRFVRDVLPKDFHGDEGKPLHRLCESFGWQPFARALQGFLTQQKPADYRARLEPIVSICEALACDPPNLTEERRAVCVPLADELVRVVERWDSARRPEWQDRQEKRAGVVEGVVGILAAVSATAPLNQFVTHVLEDRRHYDLHEALIPDVKAIYKSLGKLPAARSAAARLLQHCLNELRTATAEPVTPPKDWARDAKLGCKCDDCQALSRFLRDPAQRVGRFPMAKHRRQHLHQQIDAHGCDVTHVTKRKGSPQTLVCTKTQASYERRLKQYGVDKKLLAELEALDR